MFAYSTARLLHALGCLVSQHWHTNRCLLWAGRTYVCTCACLLHGSAASKARFACARSLGLSMCSQATALCHVAEWHDRVAGKSALHAGCRNHPPLFGCLGCLAMHRIGSGHVCFQPAHVEARSRKPQSSFQSACRFPIKLNSVAPSKHAPSMMMSLCNDILCDSPNDVSS